MNDNYYSLGDTILFPFNEDHVTGIIRATHKSNFYIEKTLAWETVGTKFRYRVEVEKNDIGFVWVDHENVIKKTKRIV